MAFNEREAARAQGLVRYFTGKPCKRGHVAERLTSTANCLECERERAASLERRPSAVEQKPPVEVVTKSKRTPIFVETENLALDAQAIANRLYAQGHVEQSKLVTATAQQLCSVVESMNGGLRTHALSLFFGRRDKDPYYEAGTYD